MNPVNFAGNSLYRPGAYSKRNIDAGAKAGGTPSNLAVILGRAEGGIPFNATGVTDEEKIMWFSKVDEAEAILREGDLMEAVRHAFEGSSDVRINAGVGQVGVIRVDNAVKSTLNLANTLAANVIKVDTLEYGLHTKGIAINVSAGTNSGQLVQIKKDGIVYERDDVFYNILNIQYVGVAAGAVTLTISETAITSTGVDGTETDLNIDLTVATNIQKVFDAIDANAAFSVSIVDKSKTEMLSISLDNVTAIDIKTAAVNLTANVEAIIDAINAIGIMEASIVAEADRVDVDNLADFTYLSGGTNGTAPTVGDWSTALSIAYNEELDGVGVCSGDSSIHALLRSHVAIANSVTGKKERVGITGCLATDDDATVKSKAELIDSSFVLFCGSRDYDFDINGNEVQTHGYLHAMKLLGMSFGNDVIEPLTHKKVKITKMAKKYGDTDINEFIKSGVVIFTPSTEGGYIVERGVTTYQGNNLIANEFSIMRTVLAITKRHRTKLNSRFTGRPGTRFAKGEIESYSLELLAEMLELGWFAEDENSGVSAITNHVVTVRGDVYDISYNGVVTAPINFILSTHNFELIGLGR